MISTALLIYLIVGPVAWALMFVGFVLARARMGRLLHWTPRLPERPPHVTILIPAKDEAAGIRRCIGAALAQDYPNFDVIVIDDRSSDGTERILDELAPQHGRLRVIHVKSGDLPGGWLGKCHALHAGTRHAAGDWLLFVDSDVTLQKQALSSALSISIQRGYDAVTILTRLECHSFLERLMLPLLAGAWSVMHTISLTNDDSRKGIAAANGQFLLIRRSAYESVGGHEAVRDQITEDVELMRLLKSHEFKVRFFLGGHLAATRMHGNLRQMFHGWARIYSGTARRRPWRILGAMWFLLVSLLSVYPAIVWGISRLSAQRDPAWLIVAVAHFVLMTGFLMVVYRVSGNRARHALLLPISGSLALAVLGYSLHKCRTGRIVWRDSDFVARSSAPMHQRRQ